MALRDSFILCVVFRAEQLLSAFLRKKKKKKMPRSSYVQGVPFKQQTAAATRKGSDRSSLSSFCPAACYRSDQAAHQLHQQHQQPQLHASHGKPAFYDANRGIHYDGQQAFFYQPDANSKPLSLLLILVMVGVFNICLSGLYESVHYSGGHHHQQQALVDSKPITSFLPILLSNSVLSPVDSLLSAMALHVYAYQPGEEAHLVTAIETSEQQLSANQQQQRAFYQQQVHDLNNNRSGYLFSA
uniref:Uncharacterized protein n=1 Tax=Ditylenchus dipsaci TaxID=166011 RepID=A0A915EN12_9BILA